MALSEKVSSLSRGCTKPNDLTETGCEISNTKDISSYPHICFIKCDKDNCNSNDPVDTIPRVSHTISKKPITTSNDPIETAPKVIISNTSSKKPIISSIDAIEILHKYTDSNSNSKMSLSYSKSSNL